MIHALLAMLLLAAPGPGVPQDEVPLPGWCASYWVDGRVVRQRVDAPALSLRSGEAPHPDLPAGAFGASYAAELPVDGGARLRFGVQADGGHATLVVRDAGRRELLRAEASGGARGNTGWLLTEPGRLVLELTYEGGAEGASLQLQFEPVGAGGLAGCVVPEVFRNELEAAALEAAALEAAALEAAAGASVAVQGAATDDAPAPDEASAPATLARPRVHLLTQSAGYQHGVVKRPAPDQLAVAELGMTRALGDRFELSISQDARDLPALLPGLDALVFYTTGELPLDEAQRQALLEWVEAGGAFVGLHCATDTMYATPAYLDMVGGTFDGHPWHEEVTLDVEWPGHPATAHLGDTWTLTDEIYQFRAFGRFPNQVLLSLSGSQADLSKGKRADGDYASAWCKPYGRGRVFYSALGHRDELWSDEAFLRHVLGGLTWALRGPDLPCPPPADAVVLCGPDGPDRSAWAHRDGGPFRWEVGTGERLGEMAVVAGGAGDLVSRRAFGDALIHVEFMLPVGHEGRGNSGVYIQGRYEVQVIDPTTAETPAVGTCGAVYGLAGPARDAIRPAGAWQTYDIRFRAPRMTKGGLRMSQARLSLWHNGVQVHDELSLPNVTPGGLADMEAALGPLMLQDHGDPVRFRNVWVVPLDG